MFLIDCPFCLEARAESEFSCAGEAFIERPVDPDGVTDQAWGDYVFFRTNTKGVFWEQWVHSQGCRKYFIIQRHTATNHIVASYTLAEARKEAQRPVSKAAFKVAKKPVKPRAKSTRKVTSKKPSVSKQSLTRSSASSTLS